MVSTNAISAMRRKAGVGRQRLEGDAMSSQRAWRTAVPRAADEVASMPAKLRGYAEEKVGLAGVLGAPGEGALIGLLEGREESFGLAILDAQALAALVEAQTTGRVMPNAAIPRKPTRTDAVLCADLIDRLLEVAEEAIAEMDAPPPIEGYRYATPLEDERAVELALSERAYLAMTLTLDLGRGAKTGTLRLVVPAVAPKAEAAGPVGERLEAALMNTEATLTAVLHRVRIPFGDLANLRPGDTIPIPLAAVGRISLEAQGVGAVGHGRLGQMNGNRAVRVLDAASLLEAGETLEGFANRWAGATQGGSGGFGGALPTLPGGLPPLDGGDGLPPLD